MGRKDQDLLEPIAGPPNGPLSRRDFLRLAGIGSAGVILAACSSPKTAKPTPSSGVSTPGATTAGATTAASAGPKRGGTLSFASTGGGGNSDILDAIHVIYDPDLARAHQLFDKPMYFNSKGEVQPGAVEELTGNPDGTMWTARMRSGVTFHDGKDLTADDLIYTFQQIADKKNPGTGAGAIATMDVAGLKKLDAMTVQIPFTAPYSIFPAVLCGVYYYVVPVGFDPKNPVGTGPFKYQSFVPGGESVFVRNDSYWQEGLPYLDEIHITDFSDETSMLNGLLSGQVNLANLGTESEAKQVQGAGGGYVVSETGSYVNIVMAVDTAPFDDQRVRTAMRLIVDRPQMNEVVFGGLGAIGNDVFGRFDPLYDQSLPQRAQDLDQAKSLLQQAKADNIQVTLTTGAIGPGAEQIAQVFAQQAKGAGVDVKVQTLTSTAFFADTYLHRSFTQDLWFSKPYLAFVALGTGPNAQYNETHFHDAHYNQLYEEALATTDNAKLTEIVHEMMKIDYDTGGNIIPVFLPSLDCFTKGVQGVVDSTLGIPFNEYDFKTLWVE
jgi:peptide/nickel transport system substrate-binding protein